MPPRRGERGQKIGQRVLGVWVPLEAQRARSTSNNFGPSAHVHPKFEDDDHVRTVGANSGYCGWGRLVSGASITLSEEIHHVLGAVKAAKSSGPGNVELRVGKVKGVPSGRTTIRKADVRLPRVEMARDRCAPNSQWRQRAWLSFRGGRMQKVGGSYSYRVASTCVHVHMYMYISMALLLSATGDEENLFPVGNIASRRLPFPAGDLVWGAHWTPRVSFDFEYSIFRRAGRCGASWRNPRDILER